MTRAASEVRAVRLEGEKKRHQVDDAISTVFDQLEEARREKDHAIEAAFKEQEMAVIELENLVQAQGESPNPDQLRAILKKLRP